MQMQKKTRPALFYVQGVHVGQVIVKFWRAFPCPVWQDILVLMFCGFSGSNESKVRGERVDETYDTMKGRAIAGVFREENVRLVRLSA